MARSGLAALRTALEADLLSDAAVWEYLESLDAPQGAAVSGGGTSKFGRSSAGLRGLQRPGHALPRSAARPPPLAAPMQAALGLPSPPSADGRGLTMLLARKEQTVRFGSRCVPAATVLQPGGRLVLAVERGAPQQAFSIGRDVEESFVTPVIPPGCTYEWTPAEPGRYFVQSEVYPQLRSTIQVLQEEQQDEATAAPDLQALAAATAARRRSSGAGSSARSSLAGEASNGSFSAGLACAGSGSGSATAAAAVDENIAFPALLAARPTYSRSTQTAGSSGGLGGGPATVSRQTSMSGAAAGAEEGAGVAPGAVFRRFQRGAAPGEEEDEAGASLLDSPPSDGLRRRGRSTSAPEGPSAAAGVQRQQQPAAAASAARPATVLPPLKQAGVPAASADGFSLLSAGMLSSGSGGSPRSGSGSERSAASAPLYVQRRIPGGMLQTTHAYSSAAAARSSFSDSRSAGGSEELQPLLYSVGSRGSGGLQAPPSYGSSGSSYRAYPAAVPPHPAEEDRGSKRLTCPRCSKVYLSSINQRRCISSHLAAGGGRGGRGSSTGSIPEAQLAAFWDGLDEGEKRGIMDVRSELNGEHLLRQLEIQKLHRQRSGAMDQLSQEQKRLHTSGQVLYSACEAWRKADSSDAAQRLTGSNLMRVLGEVSEGTFLADRNPISQEEFSTGNNLEAGLGAFLMKRLMDAHLAAKQRQADRLQRELEDQEAAQEAAKAGKQQAGSRPGNGAAHHGEAASVSKKKLKAAKAKEAKAAAAAAPAPAGKPAGKAAAARPASASGSDSEGTAAAAGTPAAAAEQQPAAPPKQQAGAEAAAQTANGSAHAPAAKAPAKAAAAKVPAATAKAPAAARAPAAAPATAADAVVLSPPRPAGEERYGSSPQKPGRGAAASSQCPNFLFAEEAAEAGADAAAAGGEAGSEAANGWRTATSGRSSRGSHHPVPKPANGSSTGSSSRPPAPPAGASTAAHGPKGGARSASRGSSGSLQQERPGSRGGAERVGSAGATGPSAPAAASATAVAHRQAPSAPANGKLAGAAAGSRHPPAHPPAAAPSSRGPAPLQEQRQPPQQQPSPCKGFPALPAAPGSKLAGAGAAPPAAPPGFSYAAAAAKSKAGKAAQGATAAATKAEAPARRGQQQQQQQKEPAAPAPMGGQPKDWPVPGSGTAAVTPASAASVQPPAAAAEPGAPAASAAAAEPAAATQPEPALPAQAAAEPAAAPAVPNALPAGAADVTGAEVESQRCASVTPPISDAGSPPPGMMGMPMPGAYPMPAWPVGPDGAPLPVPPMGYYWMPPMPPPGAIQFGSMEPGEGGAPPPYPAYPLFIPSPYAMMPPGHPGPGSMPMPVPHLVPYTGEGQLAPFPPGMPMLLPPDVAEELAAVAAAANRGQAPAEQRPASWSGEEGEEAGSAAEAAEGRDAAAAGEAPQQLQQPAGDGDAEAAQEGQPEEDWEALADAGSPPPPAGKAATGEGRRSGFLAMLQEACGVPAGAAGPAAAQPARPPAHGRRRGGSGFDAAAAAAELERRWREAAPQSVPLSSLPAWARPPASPASRPDRRSSGAGGGKPAAAQPRSSSSGKAGGKSAAGSGRASPAAGKPVVVAVRAWSTDDSAAGDVQAGPKWRIAASGPAPHDAPAHPQQQQQPAGSAASGK